MIHPLPTTNPPAIAMPPGFEQACVSVKVTAENSRDVMAFVMEAVRRGVPFYGPDESPPMCGDAVLESKTRKPNVISGPPAERGTTIEAAAILGLKPRKLQAMAQRGEIPGAAKLGRQWTYDLAKLRRFVEQQEKVTACQRSAKPRPDAIGAAEFYGRKFRSAGGASGGRLRQMIQHSQRRVGKRAKRER